MPDQFLKGTVKQIKLHNFMTFVDITVKPGPSLNILCAPNGTGKSTIACALCIGLGFSPKLLGRADNVKDFIRRGQASGWVQISLSEGEGRRDCVVKRVIEYGQDMLRGSSTWFLQGMQVTEREAKQKISQFNFQLDNLCQFLPQDKVVEFARLGPEDLLRETEKAIGRSELHEQHTQLIAQRKQMLEAERQTGVAEQQLQQAEQNLQEMERDVERFERRNQLLEEVSWLKKKSCWVKFELHQEHLRAAKNSLEEATRNLKEVQDRVQKDQAPIKQWEKSITNTQKKKNDAREQYSNAENQLEDVYLARFFELQAQVEAALNNLRSLTQQSENHQKKIQDLRSDIQECENKLKEFNDKETEVSETEIKELHELSQQLYQINQQLNEEENNQSSLEESLTQLNSQKLQYTRRLKDLDDQKMKKFRTLEKLQPGILDAYNVVQEALTNGKFRGPVIGPILLEMFVETRENAQYIENVLPRHLWSMFVTQTRQDQDALLKLFEHDKKFSPNVVNFNADPNRPLKYAIEPSEIAPEFGINTTLDKLVQAPPLIKQVLCDESSINFIYTGNSQTDDVFEQVFQNYPQINKILTCQNSYTRIRSRYNANASSTTIQKLRGAQILAPEASVDEQQARQNVEANIQRIQAQIQVNKDEKRKAEENIHKLNSERQQNSGRQQNIRKKANERRQQKTSLQGNLKSRQKQLERLQRESDPLEKQAEILAQQENDKEELVASLGRLSDQQEVCWELFQKVNSFSLKEAEGRCIMGCLQQTVNEDSKLLEGAKQTVDQLSHQTRRAREDCKQAKTIATRACQFTDEVKTKFQELPNDLEAIQLMIDEKKVQADGIVCNDDGVLQTYRQLQRDVETYRNLAENGQRTKDMVQEALTNMREEWITQLKAQVSIISNTFKDSFSKIGCSGEVQVYEDPEGDFEKYGVQIKVQFRESEEAEILSAQRQSGGERSVATMLYLLSLQSITRCPFRVVDEINQGMDPVNERKVFDQLVASSLLPDTPQSFLLTPKLLPGLDMKRGVTCLVIFNGMQQSPGFRGDTDFLDLCALPEGY